MSKKNKLMKLVRRAASHDSHSAGRATEKQLTKELPVLVVSIEAGIVLAAARTTSTYPHTDFVGGRVAYAALGRDAHIREIVSEILSYAVWEGYAEGHPDDIRAQSLASTTAGYLRESLDDPLETATPTAFIFAELGQSQPDDLIVLADIQGDTAEKDGWAALPALRHDAKLFAYNPADSLSEAVKKALKFFILRQNDSPRKKVALEFEFSVLLRDMLLETKPGEIPHGIFVRAWLDPKTGFRSSRSYGDQERLRPLLER